jgi:hypothetical protein
MPPIDTPQPSLQPSHEGVGRVRNLCGATVVNLRRRYRIFDIRGSYLSGETVNATQLT